MDIGCILLVAEFSKCSAAITTQWLLGIMTEAAFICSFQFTGNSQLGCAAFTHPVRSCPRFNARSNSLSRLIQQLFTRLCQFSIGRVVDESQTRVSRRRRCHVLVNSRVSPLSLDTFGISSNDLYAFVMSSVGFRVAEHHGLYTEVLPSLDRTTGGTGQDYTEHHGLYIEVLPSLISPCWLLLMCYKT